MRKLKLQIQLSLDGFIAGPNAEMDWMVWNWDDRIKKYVTELTEPVDCIIMGRNLALGFIPYWKTVASNSDDPQFQFGKIMYDTPKVVFTKTMDKSEWENTAIAKGDLMEEISHLKNQNGGDIIVYGGGSFVSSLIKAGLIDEFHLFINPIIIGNGMPIYKELKEHQKLTLKNVNSFDCGIVVLCYEKNQDKSNVK
jgi:dihydrofolate reductase